jgi:hypothetical protein
MTKFFRVTEMRLRIVKALDVPEDQADPSDLWQVEAYLTESRKTVDRLYRFRYSDLLRVFSILMRDDWLKEADLAGLQAEKIADIKRSPQAFRRMFSDEGDAPQRV